MTGAWAELQRPGPDHVVAAGRELRAGSRVRLHPKRGGDIFDRALERRIAFVERIEQDGEDRLHLAVSLADDPGRALGPASQLGHRFFVSPDEVEPVDDGPWANGARKRILIAGIGNVFLGDDGFGVAVADALALAGADLPPGVEVEEFGIRGMDLAYALTRGLDAAILIDAAPRGETPGTLSVIEPGGEEREPALETHGMDPLKVLGVAGALGPLPDRVLIVACEPQLLMTGEEGEVVMELSAPVSAAVQAAAELVRSLAQDLMEPSEGDPT
jgi:hydrogenase maturation protease